MRRRVQRPSIIQWQTITLRIPFDVSQSSPPHTWDWQDVLDTPLPPIVVGYNVPSRDR
jgi:hypothetical protein